MFGAAGALPPGRPLDRTDGRPHGAAPTRDGENERWTPCPAERARIRPARARRRRPWARAAARRARTGAEYPPWVRRARRQRSRPSAVRGPVLRPPCIRQRPFFMAGWRQEQPARVRAPQRGAARKSPDRAPFLRRPRRSAGRLAVEASGGNERWSPCPAVDRAVAARVIATSGLDLSGSKVR